MKSFLVGFLLIGATSGGGCNKKIPEFHRDIYVGNSLSGSIERRQGGQKVSASDSRFDRYIAIRDDDFQCLMDTYLTACEKFKYQDKCGLQPSKP